MKTYVVLISFLIQNVSAESLIAAGRLSDAARAFGKVTAGRLDHFRRDGITPAAAVRELSVTFDGPADREYLRSRLTEVGDVDRPYKLRAVEATARGFRVTTTDGRMFTLARGPGFKFGSINGRALPGPRDGAAAYLTVIGRAMTNSRVARAAWTDLFGAGAAHAAESAGGKAIVALGAVAIASLWTTSSSADAEEPSMTVDGYLHYMTSICDRERLAKTKFEGSETAKFLELSVKQNVYTEDAQPSARDCAESYDRLYIKNSKDISEKYKLERGDLKRACDRGQEFSACVKKLRNLTDSASAATLTPASADGATGSSK